MRMIIALALVAILAASCKHYHSGSGHSGYHSGGYHGGGRR